MESINVVLIHQGLAASERLAQLNAITQMRSLIVSVQPTHLFRITQLKVKPHS